MAERHPVVIIGAGIGGLAAALELAAAGVPVLVLERADAPGGKLRTVAVGGDLVDAGPTVVTMRFVFDALFAAAGAKLDDHVALAPLSVLARHHWQGGTILDLFADPGASEAAIGRTMGGHAAQEFRRFRHRSDAIYRALDASFMQHPQPSLLGVTRAAGLAGLVAFRNASPFVTLWQVLGQCFTDARLRQLFARYATYSGASPFEAPATLMLIAHAEEIGVWRVAGGMRKLADAIAALASARGATFRYGAEVVEVVGASGRATGIRLADGSIQPAAAIIANTDLGAIGAGRLGTVAQNAIAPATLQYRRSLSAVTWQIIARTTGFPLSHHNVFFSADYQAEFATIARGTLPRDATIYVCAQDRLGTEDERPIDRPERLLILVNAPPLGDRGTPDRTTIEACWQRVLDRLRQAGLTLTIKHRIATGPVEFDTMFPGSGGALYGRSLAGWRDPFLRPTARTRLPGFYLAGGSAHPGPGLPMAALSGRFAAAALGEYMR